MILLGSMLMVLLGTGSVLFSFAFFRAAPAISWWLFSVVPGLVLSTLVVFTLGVVGVNLAGPTLSISILTLTWLWITLRTPQEKIQDM